MSGGDDAITEGMDKGGNAAAPMRALVVFGSSSDAPVYERIAKGLHDPIVKVCSAHRTPELLERLLAQERYDVVIAGAGLAAHLPGVVASQTIKPVIGVPVESCFSGLDSLLAIAQMPPGIPVLSTGVGREEEAVSFLAALARAQSVRPAPPVLLVNEAGEGASKAIASCAATLAQLGVAHETAQAPREGSLSIVFAPLSAPAREAPLQGPAICVPIAKDPKAADALAMLARTTQGLWVGIGRGENAAIAAAQCLNRDGAYTAALTLHRREMRRKIYAANKGPAATYAQAGVRIDAGNEAVERMRASVRATHDGRVLADIGLFGGLYRLDKDTYEDPVLVASTDGVGTKVRLASLTGRYGTIGQDLVNHCVNDILVQGASPLFFLDYVAASRIDPAQVAQVVQGVAAACRENGCALIGGETAELPGVYRSGEFDLASCVVGVVERKKVVTGARIATGDAIIGLPSSGLHTNGYSLAMKVLLEDEGMAPDAHVPALGATLQDALLAVHRSYLAPVSRLLAECDVHGMAHITGGGLVENIPRVLPAGMDARIEKGSWEVPAIFSLIQQRGNVAEAEMYRVFNMGVGYIAIVPARELDAALRTLADAGEHPRVIGTIVRGNKEVRFA